MSETAPDREQSFPSGIVGAEMTTVTRMVPADEPPTLPVNAELEWIGKRVPRINGRAKATGAVRYTVDVSLPGMLYGRIIRSASAHARLRSVDLGPALKLKTVSAGLLIADPANPATAIVRYVGQPIAAIAATSFGAAQEAAALVRVDYQQRPFVIDMEAARAADAPAVHDATSAPTGSPSGFPAAADLKLAGNVRGPAVVTRGDVAEGLAGADVVVEGEYRTQVQTHCCMEPHAIVADWRDDGLIVYMSTQSASGVRAELANAFNLPLERVRVVVDAMGGGFGSKSSLGLYGRIAVALSRQAKAPVRLALERREEQLDSGNRPAVSQLISIGALKDGTLTAIKLVSYGTAGVGVGAGVGNFAQGLYVCPNFSSAQYDVFINAGPSSAMRGPGNTQGAYGMEQAIDELAEKLGLDPLELRDRIDLSPVRREERRRGAERIGWMRRHAPGADPGPIKRGLGVAQSLWGSNVHLKASCEVELRRDGSVTISSSVQDIGSGIGTVLAQTVAETFGLKPQDIRVRIGDTSFPLGPPSNGSRTTASLTPPARVAAWHVLQQLFAAAAPALEAQPDDLSARDGLILVRSAPDRALSFADAAAMINQDGIRATATRADDYGGFRRKAGDAAIAEQDLGGVQFAEVAVDTETGIIRVERVVAAQDCGRPMNPLLLESQVKGGVLMGVSYALYEQRVLEATAGRMLNADLEHYKLVGARDAPEIEALFIENYRAESATDAYGIAEPSNIATAPAIANAVYNAIGVRLRALPMTPQAVLTALGRVQARS